MSLRDPVKIEIAREARIKKSVCRTCGATNPYNATKCRKCHSKNLRLKRSKGKGR
ncbi:50S ribosomal protein L40e [Candidatus Bathyarchaeota archaeon]|nr:50S ribosomal protein L40e [Candidatus Bathyarchaeota archaeon]MCJ7732789.1 50S ribosomal protein L40e [Candidatus Bathyarchaeota archaeon]TFH13273.1 MAG: 50S ribosomal protein L40e [Candidatus Bathyarchaeota archaeon]